MAAKRLSMRKVREVLRLRFECGLNKTQISNSCKVSRSAVTDCLSRVKAAGLNWPIDDTLDDHALENLLYQKKGRRHSGERPVPEWSQIEKELKRKGVTKALVWQEYKEQNPTGYQYTQFCSQYKEWKKSSDVIFHHHYKAGEKILVDYAGQTVGIKDPSTGHVTQAQIFIAVLGASNYTFAEASLSQKVPDWIGSHVNAFEFFGGVSEVIIPDNLKSAVSRVDRYDPDINPTYFSMAQHYGCAIIPARPYKPRDKAKAENAVLIVERWILARIRNRTFFSLEELNKEIRKLLKELNSKPFQKLSGCREDLFQTIDKPALKALPTNRFQYDEFKIARVHVNYHVEVEKHHYSVPYTISRKEVEIRLTSTTVEIFYSGKRVASHMRNFTKHGYTTQKEHMPKSHQKYAEWSPERMINWAATIGVSAKQLSENIIDSRPVAEQAYKSILGIISLGKSYGNDRLEAACEKALAIRSPSYKSVKSILKNNLEQKPLELQPPEAIAVEHSNIRGNNYYH